MDSKKIVHYWVRSSQEDLKTAKALFKLKRYMHCLFFCHLFLEKILKGLVVKNKKTHAPLVHRLVELAQNTGVSFNKEQLVFLAEITLFNIKGRYEDYKFAFFKKADREYTQRYLRNCIKLYLWLKEKT